MTAEIYDLDGQRLKYELTDEDRAVAEELFSDPEPQVIRVRIDLPDQAPATAGQIIWQIITGFCMGVVIVSFFVGLLS